MIYGFIVIESPEDKGRPVWQMAEQEDDAIAIFAETEIFSAPDDPPSEWHETYIAPAGILDDALGRPYEYARYHPLHEEQFVSICGDCRYNRALVTHADIPDSVAIDLIWTFDQSTAEINRLMHDDEDVGRVLQRKLAGARWAYFLGFSHPALARTFFVSRTIERFKMVRLRDRLEVLQPAGRVGRIQLPSLPLIHSDKRS